MFIIINGFTTQQDVIAVKKYLIVFKLGGLKIKSDHAPSVMKFYSRLGFETDMDSAMDTPNQCYYNNSKLKLNNKILIFLIIYIIYTLVHLVYIQTHCEHLNIETVSMDDKDESSPKWLPENTYLVFAPEEIIHANDTCRKSINIFTHSEVKNEKIKIPSRRATLPKCNESFVMKDFTINKDIYKALDLDNLYPMVAMGGHYYPQDCIPKHKIAILVPFRKRERNLRLFLHNIHPFLMRQQLEYRIFVIEQYGTGLFNKGRLFNAGFLEIERMGGWQCVVFHDVDLLPTDDRIRYSCLVIPTHLCSSVVDEENNVKTNYHNSFGGVTAMTTEQFKLANGYSNEYWGWGAEDDDMFIRLNISRLGMARYKADVGKYASLFHKKENTNFLRYYLLENAAPRHSWDGLYMSNFTKLNISLHRLYTNILVDVKKVKVNTDLRDISSV